MNENQDKLDVLVAFWIPIVISSMCVMLALDTIPNGDLMERVKSTLDLLVSNFFPTFFSAAITSLVASMHNGVSGVLKERRGLLLVYTVLYLFAYLLYNEYYGTMWSVVFFTIANIVYAILAIVTCKDRSFSLVGSIISTTVKNTPN